MHPMLIAVVVASLTTSTASAPVAPPTQDAIATPTLEQSAPSMVFTPDRTSLAAQIKDRVEQHQELVQELSSRALAADIEQRTQIQIHLQDAATQMRLDIWQLQLDYARAAGHSETAEKIEANIARLREVSETPDIAVQAKRAPRASSRSSEAPAATETPAGNRSGLGTQGGQK